MALIKELRREEVLFSLPALESASPPLSGGRKEQWAKPEVRHKEIR